jgi:hypothetical protein
MKANPDKFQAVAIGPKTNRQNMSFIKTLNRTGLGLTPVEPL